MCKHENSVLCDLYASLKTITSDQFISQTSYRLTQFVMK